MRKALIVAGVAIVVGVSILAVLTWNGYPARTFGGVPQEPVVYLVVDGERYASDLNLYCPDDCNFLIYARVFSSPPVEIASGSEAAFEIDNRAISIDYDLFEYEQVGEDQIRPSDEQFVFRENGRLVIDWPEGTYVLAVTAGWNSAEDKSYSLHKFRITVT